MNNLLSYMGKNSNKTKMLLLQQISFKILTLILTANGNTGGKEYSQTVLAEMHGLRSLEKATY